MDLNARREFYEKIYFHELDVREKLEGRLRLFMTAFAVVFAMALFLFNAIVVKKELNSDAFLFVVYLGGCISLFCAIIFFVKSWYGYKYKMIPNAIDIENYHGEISANYEKYDSEQSENWTNEAFQEYLLAAFRDYSAHNTINNDRKSYNLHRSLSALLISFLLLTISYYPYYSLIHQPS